MPSLPERVSLPLDAIRRFHNTPIWKLEAAPVHMIKLTKEHEIATIAASGMIGTLGYIPAMMISDKELEKAGAQVETVTC